MREELQDQGEQGLRQTPGSYQGKAARGAAPRRERPAAPVLASGPRLGWREAIAGTVTGLGFELVEVERAQRGLLRVTIDRVAGREYNPPGEFVTVEDCEQVTRQLQYALEVEAMDYARLEVSSPGLDRLLKSEADFERFAGQAVNLTLKLPFEGRKAWQGVLGRAEAGDWRLVFKVAKTEQVLGFKFEEVREARLVPVVDFKGRRSAGLAADGGSAVATPEHPAATPTVDGG